MSSVYLQTAYPLRGMLDEAIKDYLRVRRVSWRNSPVWSKHMSSRYAILIRDVVANSHRSKNA